MKRLTFAVSALAALLMLTLAGCPNAAGLRHDADQPPAQPGTGYVTLRLGTPTGRTLLPDTFNFPGHLGYFIPVPADDGRDPVAVGILQQPQVLDVGEWRLEIAVFSYYDPDEYDDPLATGAAGPFTIVEGQNPPIIVPLVFDHGEMDGEQGTFTWNIAHGFDNAHQMEITLFYLGDARENDESIFVTTSYGDTLANALAGTRNVAAGFYIVTVRMEMDAITHLYVDGVHAPGHFTGARRAIWSDVMHVYPRGTTRLGTSDAPFAFGASDYFHDITQAWLFGHMTGWDTGNLAGKAMTLQTDGTLVWTGNLRARPNNASHYFRFSLTDTSYWGAGAQGSVAENQRRGAWIIPQENTTVALDVEVDEWRFVRLHHNHTAGASGQGINFAWIIDDMIPGYFQITLDPIEGTILVERDGDIRAEYDAVWMVGSVDPPANWHTEYGASMAGDNGIFTWRGHVPQGGAYFRFSLSETPMDGQDVYASRWLVPGSSGVVVGEDTHTGLTRVDGNTNNSWRIETPGWYVITLNLLDMEMTIARPVTGVAIVPAGASAIRRGTYGDFTATVTFATGFTPDPNMGAVTWSLQGSHHAGTTYAVDGNTVRLTVSAVEPRAAITLRATSTQDPGRHADFAVTIPPLASEEITALWLVGEMYRAPPPAGWLLPGLPMTRVEPGGTVFRWQTGDLHGGDLTTANSRFRFSLVDMTGLTAWNGLWLGDEDGPTDITPDATITIGAPLPGSEPSAADWNWRIPDTGWYTITVDTGATPMTLRVERPVIADHVAIQGVVELRGGDETTFTATVTGRNDPADSNVDWTLVGEPGDDFNIQTRINSATGLLEIYEYETARYLTIRATFRTTRPETGTAAYGERTIRVLRNVTIAPPFDTVLDAEGRAFWDHDRVNLREFSLQLYRDGEQVGTPITRSAAAFTYNLAPAIRELNLTGNFHFTVAALSSDDDYGDSPASAASNTQTVTRRPQAGHTWWLGGTGSGVARWVNPDGSGDYIIRLYRNDDNFVYQWSVNRGSFVYPGGTPHDPNRTVTDFDFVITGGRRTVDSTDTYHFTVTSLSTGPLMLDAETRELPTDMWGSLSVLGSARVWTIASGGGRYVAGAGNGRIAWSDDGVIWNLANQTNATDTFDPTAIFGTNDVRGIAHGGDGIARFVAVGHGGRTATSTCGAIWAAMSTANDFGTTNIVTIAYGNGSFVAGGAGGNIRRSDGVTWSYITPWNAGAHGPSVIFYGHYTVEVLVFDAVSGRFLAVGAGGGRRAHSGNGLAWQWMRNTITENNAYDVRHGAVSSAGAFVFGVHNNQSAIRANTLNVPEPVAAGSFGWGPWWADTHHHAGNGIQSLAYGHGRFVAVGTGGLAGISIGNNDGANWASLPNPLTGDITAAHVTANGIILAGPGVFTVVPVPAPAP